MGISKTPNVNYRGSSRKDYIMNAIISLTIIALIVLVLVPTMYALYTLVPKVIDFVKSFIKWHFHD